MLVIRAWARWEQLAKANCDGVGVANLQRSAANERLGDQGDRGAVGEV